MNMSNVILTQVNSEESNFPPEAVAALEEGHFTEAAQAVRTVRHSGLNQAKAIVARYLENHAGLRERCKTAHAYLHCRPFFWFATVVFTVAGTYLLWHALPMIAGSVWLQPLK